MECGFRSGLEDGLGRLLFLYGFCCFKYGNFGLVAPDGFATWRVSFRHRADKRGVGRKLALKEIFKTERYHARYGEYGCSKYG